MIPLAGEVLSLSGVFLIIYFRLSPSSEAWRRNTDPGIGQRDSAIEPWGVPYFHFCPVSLLCPLHPPRVPLRHLALLFSLKNLVDCRDSAFGSNGCNSVVPPNSTLVYEVVLLAINGEKA